MLKKFIIKPLILFLLLSQFATMVHALEHQLVEEEHEVCSICIHQMDSKNLLIETNKLFSLDFNKHEKVTNTPCYYTARNLSQQKARSPPYNLI